MPYIKRFQIESSSKKQNYLGDNPDSKEILLTDTAFPRLLIKFNDPNVDRMDEEVDAEQFIAVKGFKAKGKRLTTYPIASVTELEPTRFPEPEEDSDESVEEAPEVVDPDEGKSDSDIRDELTGQLKLF